MTGIVDQLLIVNVVLAGSITVVGLSRGPLRKVFGSAPAYAAWAAVPVSFFCCFVLRDGANLSGVYRSGEGPIAAIGHSASAATSGFSLMLLGIWGAGVIATASALGLRQAAYLAWLGSLSPVPGEKRRVRAARTGLVAAVVGLLNPKVVTGADFDDAFTSEERALILAHEDVHINRGDFGVNAVAAAAKCALWFNPWVHWASARIRADQELVCDAAVVGRFPEKRKAYAELLLKAQLETRKIPIGCNWPTSQGSLLKERIMMVASLPRKKTRTSAGLVTAGFLALAVGSVAWAATEDASLTGSWSFSGDIKGPSGMARAKPACTFAQSDGKLSGNCQGPNSGGPVTGTVQAEHVSWRWEHTSKTKAGLSGVSSFDGVIGPDKVIRGTWTYSGLPGVTGDFKGQRE